MKPEQVDLRNVRTKRELVERVLQTRSREVRRLAGGLEQRDKRGLHDFRIACKRLRYAAERFEKIEPSLAPAAECLARLQDALGEAHDRDVLLSVLPAPLAQTERKLQREREDYVDRAAALWHQMQEVALTQALTFFE